MKSNYNTIGSYVNQSKEIAEIKKLYVGLQEGKSFVNLYWNSGIDTSLEKEVEMQVITIGVDNGKDIDFLDFLNINSKIYRELAG